MHKWNWAAVGGSALALMCFGFLLGAAPAYAALLAEDRFYTSATPSGQEYAAGTLAGQSANTLGFSGPWFTSNGSSPTIIGTSLNYTGTGYPAEVGGSMLSPTGDSRIHRLLNPSLNPFDANIAGTYYMSLLLQTGATSSAGYRAFEMHYGGNDDSANRKLQIGKSTFSDFPSTTQFGFRVNNSSSLDASLGTVDANVHLFLVKFNLSTTNNADSITVWNNPNISSIVADPAGGVTVSGFNFLADRLGGGHFTGNAYGLDELRLGTTLADVARNSLFCDLNGNGVCNSTDTRVLSDHMFLAGTYADGDVDRSGTIDFADFRLLKDHPAKVAGFDPPGAGGSVEGAIPEPATVFLMLVALPLAGCLLVRAGCRQLANTCLAGLVLVGVIVLSSQPLHAAPPADDLLMDDINLFSGATLHMRPYAATPAGFTGLIQMTHKPSDTRLFVATEQGSVFTVNEDNSGNTTTNLWFDAAAALTTATGRTINYNGSQQGLQSVAFHPNFEREGQPGYGKLYTTMLENRPANPSDPAHFYLGNSGYGGATADGVLAEWTYDHGTGEVNAASYREMFRVNMPNYDHPIKLAQFNQHSEPGDEDYGLLYVTHGDSNNQDSLNDDPQDRGDVMGKMLRINPLQSGADRYTVPSTNPFFSSSAPSPSGTAVLGEVYAYGFRNPHNYSFNEDAEGNVHILESDIGRSNMEEVNLVVPGGNYGWTKREGTFVHKQGSNYPIDAGYKAGVSPLAANEVTVGIGPDGNHYIYPVAQYDHNDWNTNVGDDYTATSIAGGFVINNDSDPALQNQFIFHNFAWQNGNVYHTDFDEMRDAVTQLDPGDTSRDEPSELTQATKYRLHLGLDHDNDPLTAEVPYDTLETLITGNAGNQYDRSDARFGEGIAGEMYISNKTNSQIFLVTNTVPDNRLTLTVDRATSELTITNATGSNLDVVGLSVFSPSGSLDPVELESADAGWAFSPYNTARDLSQANDAGSLVLTDVSIVPLGDVYDPQLLAFGEPVGEDLQFVFETAGTDGRKFVGDVVYTGVSAVPNTIVLTVDVASGTAVMLNQTPFPQELEGYTIGSDLGSLNSAGWDSLEDQAVDDGDWLASSIGDNRLTEVQDIGTTTFDDATPYALGEIFATGADQDLDFQFLLAGENELRDGDVVYVLAGDYNGDDVVDAADYTVWRNNLGSSERLANDLSPGLVNEDDYDTWRRNYGAVMPMGGGGGTSTAVPEPATLWLLIAAGLTAWTSRTVRPRA